MRIHFVFHFSWKYAVDKLTISFVLFLWGVNWNFQFDPNFFVPISSLDSLECRSTFRTNESAKIYPLLSIHLFCVKIILVVVFYEF